MLTMGPGVQTTEAVTSPSQRSRAVTAGEQVGRVGLQPRSPPVGRLSRTGGVVSSRQVNVTVARATLPQASRTVYSKVRVRLHALISMTSPGVQTISAVRLPSQSSDAVTASEQRGRGGLQPRSPPIGRLLKTGAVVSCFQV